MLLTFQSQLKAQRGWCRYNNGRYYLLVDGDTPVVRLCILEHALHTALKASTCWCCWRPACPAASQHVPACRAQPAAASGARCGSARAVHRPLRACVQQGWKLSRNQDLRVLHVGNASAFAAGLPSRYVPGDTLIFDFIYFLHPVRASASPCRDALAGCTSVLPPTGAGTLALSPDPVVHTLNPTQP